MEEQKYPGSTGELSMLLSSIALGIKIIGNLVATAGFKGLSGYSGNVNVQGEQTHRLDEEADETLVGILGSSGHFGSLVSEERDEVVESEYQAEGAKYVVAFDPLDGSSNIGSNIPVGTIFTIFRKRNGNRRAFTDDFLQSGRSIVAAGYSVYGAKTSFVYSCGNGVHGFTLDPNIGEFMLTEKNIRMPDKGNIYSVNEGAAKDWTPDVASFVAALKGKESYTSRYVGSLVADFDRNLRKGGIFLHPANSKHPRGKLRLLYECMPLAYIAEQAGGMASNGLKNILDIQPRNIHERCPFIVGGKYEIEMFNGRR
jgi:fructose-1,6-bisphosphatase I